MMGRRILVSLIPLYVLVIAVFSLIAAVGNRVVSTISFAANSLNHHIVVIDPGHGGVDGGATSCTGVLESKINLDIALRLNDMLHLFGVDTVMVRDTDRSVYTQGDTIAQKKVSDLRERVRVINETSNAFLISIHQNTYPEGKYWGLQVFYPGTDGSKDFAEKLQTQFKESLMPENNRKIKRANGIYLMEHINCPGVLIECGFLSNPREEALLRSEAYQKNLCAVISATYIQHLSDVVA
jgi:N-acetylmuramoyl-L-alanine amidase